jgi:hypothetical protein
MKDVTTMAVSPANSSTAGTVSVGPDRTIPEALVQLALLAVRRGAHEVGIHHSGLGYEFRAPIGWIVRIRRDEHHYDVKTVDDLWEEHQIGCDVAEITAPAWLVASAADGTPDAPTIAGYLELFEDGLRNNWEMTYTRHTREHGVHLKVMTDLATEKPYVDSMGLRHSVKGYSFAYRSRTGKSHEISLSGYELDAAGESIYEIADSGKKHGPRDRARAVQLLTNPAPGYVPVAYFDKARERWVK